MPLATFAQTNQKHWFKALPPTQKKLIEQSFQLINLAKSSEYFDYSYIVMPSAKAFEGFIKDVVFDLGLISRERYEGKRFRVGKALNPEIARQHPDGFEILYDDLKKLCHGERLPALLWQAWTQCRNQVFHYFVNRPQRISLEQAEARVHQLVSAMEITTQVCKIDLLRNKK